VKGIEIVECFSLFLCKGLNMRCLKFVYEVPNADCCKLDGSELDNAELNQGLHCQIVCEICIRVRYAAYNVRYAAYNVRYAAYNVIPY
jgi:hypothetical protein